ncbi:MAG: hypothetical protein WA702_10250 [Bradyrhizobium sp.]
MLAYWLFMWRQEQGEAEAAATVAKLVDLPAAGGVGITADSVAIGRA